MIQGSEDLRLIALSRRQFLSALGALYATGACRPAPRRDSVLFALVNEVVAVDLLEVERRSRDLARAARRLLDAPAEAELVALRAAWRRAALAWKRASAFREGPLLSSGALARAAYWPTRSAAICEVLRAERAPSAALVAELGADVKGLYALEYLLFDPKSALLPWQRLSGSGGARTRELVCHYAEDVCALAEQALRLLGRGGGSFAISFSRTGQQGLTKLVTVLADAVENLVVARLTLVLWLESMQRLRAVDVEGGPAGISHELALALLLGSQRIYAGARGGGLADLVEHAAPQIHARVKRAFEGSIAALRGFAAPIESVAQRERGRVESALRTAKDLELTLKTELPSALGLTLAFSSLDAD